jgi:RimK family alpha-L-glutamate ligase
VNPAHAVLTAGDKWSTHLRLAGSRIPTVSSTLLPFATGLGVADSLTSHVLDAVDYYQWPVVVKQVHGHKGDRVYLLTDVKDVLGWAGDVTWARDPNPWIVQPFITGSDVRVIVVDGEPVASLLRIPRDGDFRGNESQGATSTPWAAPQHVLDTAIRASTSIGLGLAGIDMLVTAEGESLVVEVNSNPTLSREQFSIVSDVLAQRLASSPDSLDRTV